jgi:hypothetical protein
MSHQTTHPLDTSQQYNVFLDMYPDTGFEFPVHEEQTFPSVLDVAIQEEPPNPAQNTLLASENTPSVPISHTTAVQLSPQIQVQLPPHFMADQSMPQIILPHILGLDSNVIQVNSTENYVEEEEEESSSVDDFKGADIKLINLLKIHQRGLKKVDSNPTEIVFQKIPDIKINFKKINSKIRRELFFGLQIRKKVK